jgi:hypothetical protein
MAMSNAYEHLGIKYNSNNNTSEQTEIFWGDYG